MEDHCKEHIVKIILKTIGILSAGGPGNIESTLEAKEIGLSETRWGPTFSVIRNVLDSDDATPSFEILHKLEVLGRIELPVEHWDAFERVIASKNENAIIDFCQCVMDLNSKETTIELLERDILESKEKISKLEDDLQHCLSEKSLFDGRSCYIDSF
jgi:hypothetical protein